MTNLPPDPSENEEEMFRSIERGIICDKYDKIPVEVTGKEAITPIQSFEEANLGKSLSVNVQKNKVHQAHLCAEVYNTHNPCRKRCHDLLSNRIRKDGKHYPLTRQDQCAYPPHCSQ